MEETQTKKQGLDKFFEFLRRIWLILAGFLGGVYVYILAMKMELRVFITDINPFVLLVLLVLLVLISDKKRFLKIEAVFLMVYLSAVFVYVACTNYRESLPIDTTPNIEVDDYLPFKWGSKIVKLKGKSSLQLSGDLPIVDGAAAVFPVYSAFINATYPMTMELGDGTFEYNNTDIGYRYLAERKTDIFFGAYPSENQIEYMKECGTEFEYTQIGSEAFVFIVHKDNPVESLTTEQIQDIYSGKIKNWKEVGGADNNIVPFQRNEGSGSQSMLVRFMDGKMLMAAPTEMVNGAMSGLIEQVANYRSTTASMGFSFRYYVEEIIRNPDIKMISIDGVAPTVENIKNGSYPAITPLYAVTYKENENENVERLLKWILSDEGQKIIEKTGYVGIKK